MGVWGCIWGGEVGTPWELECPVQMYEGLEGVGEGFQLEGATFLPVPHQVVSHCHTHIPPLLQWFQPHLGGSGVQGYVTMTDGDQDTSIYLSDDDHDTVFIRW